MDDVTALRGALHRSPRCPNKWRCEDQVVRDGRLVYVQTPEIRAADLAQHFYVLSGTESEIDALIAAVEARAALTPERLAKALTGDGVYDLLDRFVHGEGDVLREDIARSILAAPDTTEGTDDR